MIISHHAHGAAGPTMPPLVPRKNLFGWIFNRFTEPRQWFNQEFSGRFFNANFNGGVRVEWSPIGGLLWATKWAARKTTQFYNCYHNELKVGVTTIGAAVIFYYCTRYAYNNLWPPQLLQRARLLVSAVATDPLVAARSESNFIVVIRHLQLIKASTQNPFREAAKTLASHAKKLTIAHKLATRASSRGSKALSEDAQKLIDRIETIKELIASRIKLAKKQPEWNN